MKRYLAALIVTTLTISGLVISGCGGDDSSAPAEMSNDTGPGEETQDAATQPLSPPPAPSVAAPAPQEVQREKAEAGVGKKGRGLGTGLISTPITAYFRVQQRVVFDMQVTPALRLYKAEHEKGPKTHEEFMEKIIKANNIILPELPQGDRYVYDPEAEQLMVEHPK